jgi:uncharacterized protein YjbI with pentapeptide repeats
VDAVAERPPAALGELRLDEADLSASDLRGAVLRGSDLRDARLADADLTGADLAQTFLTGANFVRADLSGANLSQSLGDRAHLCNARLVGANLRGADLGYADLGDATLRDADLRGANLGNARLTRTDLRGANLTAVNLGGSSLRSADLTGATLAHASLDLADLSHAVLRDADLRGAALNQANLFEADLSGANLAGAHLMNAVAVGTDLRGADLTGCWVYGIAAWDVQLDGATQSKLRITRTGPHVQVDDLEVAQFVHLLMNRSKLRNVLTTLGEKAVLVLGRFTERKPMLDAIADKLRALDYLPIIFDFERPSDRDLTETVKVLAGLSLFVIADITNPRSVPLELQATVPDYMVPFVTVVQRGQPVFAMFDDLPGKYDWALPLLEYNSAESLLAAFEDKIVAPALDKLAEVRRRKALPRPRRSAED